MFPGYAATPMPARVSQRDPRDVQAAIHEPAALQVTCQSIFRPEPTARWIEPHALAFDGSRRHARAFCQNDQMFKDLLLSRIVEIGNQGPITSDPDGDADWHDEITLEIGPHPELSPTQRRAIEMDYGMMERNVHIPVRRALLFYTRSSGLASTPIRPRGDRRTSRSCFIGQEAVS